MANRVLFIFPSLKIGGTTVSVRNLISLLEKEGVECFAMPLVPFGKLASLYEGVKMIPPPFVIRALAIGSWKDEKSYVLKCVIAFLRFLRNNIGCFEKIVVGKTLDRVSTRNKIDTLVACQESISTRFVSYSKIKKVAWVRCDYKRVLEDTGKEKDGFYEGFKAIVCVSDQTCLNFKSIYPEYASKIYCINNPQDESLIKSRADMEEIEPRFITNCKTLISVGRLDEVKRFDRIASVARKLINSGFQFRWYLIGDGTEKQRIADAINQYNVNDYVIMLGAKTNPFYYIKRADALVCLSRSEACPRVVNEAKILHTPTISTDFPSIYEFIEDGITGIITNIDDIDKAIIRLFSDKVLYVKISDNIEKFSFDNTEIINKVKIVLA